MSELPTTKIRVVVPELPQNQIWRSLHHRSKVVLLPLSPPKVEHHDSTTGTRQSIYYAPGIAVDDVRTHLLSSRDANSTTLVLRHTPSNFIFELVQDSGMTLNEAIGFFARLLGTEPVGRRITLHTMEKEELRRVFGQHGRRLWDVTGGALGPLGCRGDYGPNVPMMPWFGI